MTVLIDTSSLLAFVRYYLPFDKSDRLKKFLEAKFDAGEILVLDKVAEESRFTAKGIILSELAFLADNDRRAKIVKTNQLLPTKKFFNLLENQFCNKDVLRGKGITDAEFETEKNTYLEKADAKLLPYAINSGGQDIIIVTEETASANDSKLFRKIPDCCNAVGIKCCTLPTLLENHYGIDLGELLKGD